MVHRDRGIFLDKNGALLCCTILMQSGLCEFGIRVKLHQMLTWLISQSIEFKKSFIFSKYTTFMLQCCQNSPTVDSSFFLFFISFQVAIKSWQMNTYCFFKLCPFFTILTLLKSNRKAGLSVIIFVRFLKNS